MLFYKYTLIHLVVGYILEKKNWKSILKNYTPIPVQNLTIYINIYSKNLAFIWTLSCALFNVPLCSYYKPQLLDWFSFFFISENSSIFVHIVLPTTIHSSLPSIFITYWRIQFYILFLYGIIRLDTIAQYFFNFVSNFAFWIFLILFSWILWIKLYSQHSSFLWKEASSESKALNHYYKSDSHYKILLNYIFSFNGLLLR